MKATDLRERSAEDLRELEKTLTRDLFQNRFRNFTNRLDDTSAIKKTRRDLARVKTLLAQLAPKGSAAGVGAQAAAGGATTGGGDAAASPEVTPKKTAAKKATRKAEAQ